MKTTNEEKAKQLAIKYCKDIDSSGNECYNIGCEIACNEAMQWKDEQHKQEKQQLIDEACKWLAENDSYAIPTNVQVDRLREHLNNIK